MEPTTFDRVMFATLVPALAAPFGGALGMYVVNWSTGSDFMQGIGVLAGAALLLVLFCSMTFNAWVLLRRARTWQTRSIPSRVGKALLVLYGTLVLWFLVGLIPGSSVFAWLALFGTAVAIESIVVLSVIGSTAIAHEPRASELTLGPRARWWVTVYLVAAALVLIYSVVLTLLPDTGSLSAAWPPLAILLGLPWSPALTLITIVAGFGGIGGSFLVLVLPLVANIGLAVALLATPRSQAIALRVLFFQGGTQDTRLVGEVE